MNAAPDGTPSDNNNYGSGSVISGNGEYVAFTSAASNLVEGVSGGPQVYVKNLSTGEVVVASETADGIAGNGYSAINSMSFSSDGRFLAFESSASNLVEGDTNDKYDVFVKDLQTGAIELVSVGNDDAQARDAGISDDGTTITFRTWGDNGSDIFAVVNPLHPALEVTTSGQLTISDADAGEDGFQAETLEGAYGTLSIEVDGSWTYSLDSDFTMTGDVTSVDDIISVRSIDGTTQNVTVTINEFGGASNLAPVAHDDAFVVTATEDGSWTFTADALVYNDVDVDGTVSISSVTSEQGAITEDGNGTYTFTPTFPGSTAPVEINYSIVDEDGEEASAVATVSVTPGSGDDVFVSGPGSYDIDLSLIHI